MRQPPPSADGGAPHPAPSGSGPGWTRARRLAPPLALIAVMAGEEVRAQAHPASPPSAQVPAETTLTYPSSFYAHFTPQTVLDMLERTPGFTLDVGESMRGFAAGGGNVLINGQRPSTKAEGLEDALRRIPAAHVERIEIIRGGLAGQLPGRSLVANVVSQSAAPGAGAVALTIERGPQGRIFPNGEASYTGPVGRWQASITAGFELEHHPFHGRYRITDATNAVTETWRDEDNERYAEGVLSGSLSGPFAGGELNLNGRRDQRDVKERQGTWAFAGADESVLLRSDDLLVLDRITDVQLGVDWTRPLTRDWSAKIIGLASWGRTDQDQELKGLDADGGRRSETFELRQRSSEQISRLAVSRTGEHRFLPEVGAEVARNTLKSRLAATVGEDGAATSVDLPGANVRVTELRGEAFVNLKTRLWRGLDLETGVAGEWSRISVRGDASSGRSLTYLKPRAALLWKAGPSLQWRLAFERSVGQLDFTDFAASVEATDDRSLGGNAELRPDVANRLSLGLDHRYGRGGAISIEVYQDWREDVLEYVLLEDGSAALGNVDQAKAWGATVKITHPLEPLVPGGQLRLEGEFEHTRLRDPIDSRKRRINGTIPSSVTVGFRQDLARWRGAWGVDFSSRASEHLYFPGETLVDTNHALWEAYVEKTLRNGVKLKLQGYALTDVVFDRERRLTSVDAEGTHLGSEWRRRKRGGAYSIVTVSKSF